MASFKKSAALSVVAAAGSVFLVWLIAAQQTAPVPVSPYGTQPPLQPTQRSGVAIAPVEQALTLARFNSPQGLRLMRVQRYQDGQVSGLDITEAQRAGRPDPVTLWNQLGYEAIAAAGGPAVTVAAEALELPFDGTAQQIAMGATYPEHAKEATLAQPFVFPKLRPADRWNVDVPARQFLLDYEIELGFVALADVRAGSQPRHFGLVLASDYTDRARMLRDLDLGNTHSGQGFVGGKSVVPAMPIGALFVIPRDLGAFTRQLALRLYVNGQPRQLAEPRLLAWDIRRMLDESLARREMRFRLGGGEAGEARLPIREGSIPARTLVLSGTSDGVAFRPPSGRQIFVGVVEWLASFRWHDPQRVIEPTIREAYRNRSHLQPGDQVVMHADGLGLIVNTVQP
jgi:2-keto-4-pentenoate hydratase/2-oxohepta-3-ene-1,7-dioic acid hydratase in catechol pathway